MKKFMKLIFIIPFALAGVFLFFFIVAIEKWRGNKFYDGYDTIH